MDKFGRSKRKENNGIKFFFMRKCQMLFAKLVIDMTDENNEIIQRISYEYQHIGNIICEYYCLK